MGHGCFYVHKTTAKATLFGCSPKVLALFAYGVAFLLCFAGDIFGVWIYKVKRRNFA